MNLANRFELRNKIIDTLNNQKCRIEADERDENYNYGIDICISVVEEIFKNCEVEEKLQQEYEALAEAHEALAYDWAKLKKENKELHDYYDDMRKNYNELVIKFDNLYSELYEEGYIEDD